MLIFIASFEVSCQKMYDLILLYIKQAYFMLDELLLGGDIQETSKKNVLKAIAAQDLLQEEETPQGFFEDHGLG